MQHLHERGVVFRQFLSGICLLIGLLIPAFATDTDKTTALLDVTARPATIVCLGDSVTGVYYHTGGKRAYPEMLELAIRQAVPGAMVTVINAGISGHTTQDGLARFDRDVLSRRPDLVTISFGLNDMVRVSEDQFRRNLDTLVERCRAAGCLVVLCTPNSVITSDSRPVKKLIRYCDLIRAAGRDQKVPVCDQFTAGEALKASDPRAWRLTLSDSIHPNMAGHKLMAEELCRTITGRSTSLTDLPPASDPLALTMARIRRGQPVRVLAMSPFEKQIETAIRRKYPDAVVEVTPWPVDGRTLGEIETAASQTVRKMKPDLVVIAVPRSATAEPDEEFARSYSWVMNWSLSFGRAEWDCVVIHSTVAAPADSSPRDALVRRLVAAQDLHLVDRAATDASSSEVILSRWIESLAASPGKAN